MKKKILLLMGVFSLGIIHAQVGINTQNPLGVFHIDPHSNTTQTGSVVTNNTDDVLVDNNGNIGIGLTSPEAAIHIKTSGTTTNPVSGFRLQDGNEGLGKALIALDNTGLATWQTLTFSEAVAFVKPGGSIVPNLLITTTNYQSSNAYINLPSGRWLVMVVMYMTGNNTTTNARCIVRCTFSESSASGPFNSIVTNDIEGGNVLSASLWTTSSSGVLSGSLVINNLTQVTKRYYFMLGGITVIGTAPAGTYYGTPGGPWGEDNIIAFRIPSSI